MSYNEKRKEYSRSHFWFCEIETNGNTFRFCQKVGNTPIGINAVPVLAAQSVSPAKIDTSGGIGIRATSSVSIMEFEDEIAYGSIGSPVRFWANWRAKNKNYQGGRLSIFSGYVDPSENYVFNIDDFTKRDYVIDSFSMNHKMVSLTGKDALKLVSDDRVKIPKQSAGVLAQDLSDNGLNADLLPAGIGDLEYPISGLGRVGDEVVSFTRTADSLSLVRGSNNTEKSTHSEGDSFQLCKSYNGNLDEILIDIIINDSGLNPALIDNFEWGVESDTFFPTIYSALITKPTGASKLLKELGETAPHYIYYDDRVNLLKFKAVKAPVQIAKVYNEQTSILDGSLQIKDKPELRISTVIVNYGQLDPTKELDVVANYKQGLVRFDEASVVEYNGIQAYKVINTRWISIANNVGAIRLAEVWGRRFSEMPREVSFSLDAKDIDLWTGDTAFIKTSLFLDEITGEEINMAVQITSVAEVQDFKYSGIQHTFGAALSGDIGDLDPIIRELPIRFNRTNINIRDEFIATYGNVIDADFIVILKIYENVNVGSFGSNLPSIETGNWPELTGNVIIDNSGRILGASGDGNGDDGFTDPNRGGTAISVQNQLTVVNNGLIGGGGGGGGVGISYIDDNNYEIVGGGGGAGFENSNSGGESFEIVSSTKISYPYGPNGSLETGALGIVSSSGSGVTSGDGGDLGQPGTNGDSSGNPRPVELEDIDKGGIAGVAIAENGFTVTYDVVGDIRGAIIP